MIFDRYVDTIRTVLNYYALYLDTNCLSFLLIEEFIEHLHASLQIIFFFILSNVIYVIICYYNINNIMYYVL